MYLYTTHTSDKFEHVQFLRRTCDIIKIGIKFSYNFIIIIYHCEIIHSSRVSLSEYCFTSLSVQLWQYRDRKKLEAVMGVSQPTPCYVPMWQINTFLF